MYTIIARRQLCANVISLTLLAPRIAAGIRPGQLVLLRPSVGAQPIPLSVTDWDPAMGTITIVLQAGTGTQTLSEKRPGDCVQDLTGPLGHPAPLEGIRRAVVTAGGLGCAVAYPLAKALHLSGCYIHSILGFRNRELMLLQEEFSIVSDHLTIVTDDGSFGEKALVTDPLKRLLEAGEDYDLVIAMGSLAMMKFVSITTTPYGIPTLLPALPDTLESTVPLSLAALTTPSGNHAAIPFGPDALRSFPAAHTNAPPQSSFRPSRSP